MYILYIYDRYIYVYIYIYIIVSASRASRIQVIRASKTKSIQRTREGALKLRGLLRGTQREAADNVRIRRTAADW